jgi:hypothetical protein
VGACAPLTESRGGSRGANAWGGRGSARCRAVYGRGGRCSRGAVTRRGGAPARRGGVRGCDGGDVRRGHSSRRTLEEEEARLLHPEVGSRSSRSPILERQKFNPSVSAFIGWCRPCPPRTRQGAYGGRVRPHIPTRRRSSRAPRVTESTAVAASEAPRSVAAAMGPQQVAAATTAFMTMAVTAPSIPPVPAPVSGS